MEIPVHHRPRLSRRPLLGSAWALAGVVAAVVLIGASLTLLGRDVLGFGDWHSLREASAPALSAPDAPATVRSPPRDGGGARTAVGTTTAQAAGGAFAEAEAAPAATTVGAPLPGATRRGGGDGRSRAGGEQPGSGGGGDAPADDVTPLGGESEVPAAVASDGGTLEEQGGFVVEVRVGDRRYALPEDSKLEVRVAGGRPEVEQVEPAAPSGTSRDDDGRG